MAEKFDLAAVKEAEKFMAKEIDSYDGTEPYIFISYSHRDTMEVYKILKLLEKEKYRFWYDDTMEIGEDFREELRRRIEECSAFLVFLSENYYFCIVILIYTKIQRL